MHKRGSIPEKSLIAFMLILGAIGMAVMLAGAGILQPSPTAAASAGITGLAAGEFGTAEDPAFNTEPAPNQPPAFTGGSLSTLVDTPLSVDLAALFYDPEGGALTFIATSEDVIDVSIDGSIATFTPAPGFNGERTITIITTDGVSVLRQPVKLVVDGAAVQATAEEPASQGFGTQDFTTAAVPSIAQVILNSTNPATNDTNQNLTLFVINATDADNDVVQNITDWRVNNRSLALLNMPFETNQSGNTTSGAIRDYSTFGSNGTLGDGTASQAPIWNNTDLIGGGYAFDGSNDLITIPDSPIWIFGTNNFTMDLWVNFNAVNAGSQGSIPNNFIAQDEGGGSTNKWIFTLSTSPAVLSFHVNNPGAGINTFLADTDFTPVTNRWYHLAVRRNGTTFSIYINGTKGATEELSGAVPDAAAKVQISSSEGVGFINGQIDEVHIWNRSLSDEEIALIYREGNQSRRRVQTFVSQDTTTGEVWQTCVTPNDNQTDGNTTCSNNVAIQEVAPNAAPSIAQVVLNSTNPLTNDTNQNLTLFVINATDADNNVVQNVTDWRVNNASIAVIYLPFETNVASLAVNAVRDYGTFARNATLGGGNSSQEPVWNNSGRVGGAYVFDGINDFINATVPTTSLDNWTLEAWVNPRTLPTGMTGYFISNGADDTITANGYAIGFQDGNGTHANLSGLFSGIAFLPSDLRLAINQFQHIVMTRRAGTTFFYLNGVQGNVTYATTPTTPTQFRIGSQTNIRYINGTIDEVRIWNRSLTPDQIRQNYVFGSAGRSITSIVHNETVIGDVWAACVTPNDNQTDGTTVCSNNVTISGAPAPGITSCPVTINQSTTLTQNISSNGTCITIGADHVVLDCAGFTIAYTGNFSNRHGVFAANRTNVTVRNCVINNLNSTGEMAENIEFLRVNVSTIENSVLRSNDSAAIAVQGGNGTLLSNNTLFLASYQSNVGVDLGDTDVNTTNARIVGNRIRNDPDGVPVTGGTAVQEGVSLFNTSIVNLSILHNTIATPTGIKLKGSGPDSWRDTSIVNNTINITNNLVSPVDVKLGIMIEIDGGSAENVLYTTIENNTIRALGNSTSIGIRLIVSSGANGGDLTNMTGNVILVNGTGSRGISISKVENSTLRGNTIVAQGLSSFALELLAANGTALLNNVLANSSGWVTGVDTLPTTFANFTNTTFETPQGSIRIISRFEANTSTLTQFVLNVTPNRAFLNSSLIPELNKSAQVVLRGVNSSTILADFNDDRQFDPCPASICTFDSADSNSVTFNVTGFTTYASGDGNVLVTLSKTDLPDPVTTGSALNYTVNFSVNFGNASNVTLTDTYPPQVVFQSAQPTPITGTNNTFILGNLTNGTTFIVNVSVLVLEVANGTVINNTANVSYQNATSSQFFINVTEQTTVQNVTFEFPVVGGCPATINTSAQLSANITSNGTCITFGTSNIILDCAEFTIRYGGKGAGVGVTGGFITNVTVRNCIIIDINASGSNGYGINFTNTNNSLIVNNSILTNGTTDNYGIFIRDDSHRNRIENNTIRAQGSDVNNYGMYLFTIVSNNTMRGNSIFTNGTVNNYGIFVDTTAFNNTIENNSVNARGDNSDNIGMRVINTAIGNRILSNFVLTNSVGTGHGIELGSTAEQNIIQGNTVRTNGTGAQNIGIRLVATSSNNNITGNNVSTDGVGASNEGIRIEGSCPCANNTVMHNVVRTNGTSGNYGIQLATDVTGTKVVNNTIRTNGSSGSQVGIRLTATNDNTTIENNTIVTGAEGNQNHGIQVTFSSFVNVTGNSVTTTAHGAGADLNEGILFDTSSHRSRISYNRVAASGTAGSNFGIELLSSAYGVVEFNNVSTNGTNNNEGIRVNGANNATVRNNIVYTNGSDATSQNYGIRVTGGTHRDTNVSNNFIVTNGQNENHGIFVDTPNNITFVNNTIRTNGSITNPSYGIYLSNVVDIRFFNTTLNDTVEWIEVVTANFKLNFTNTTFIMPNGSVNIHQFNLSEDISVTKARLNITFNRAFLNSTALRPLNRSAIIMLNGIAFTDPKPQFDFEDDGTLADCTPTANPFCTELSYAGGVYVFNTSHFTTFQSAEGLVNITGCPVTINQSTTLTQNIFSTSSCITFGANNTVLDCAGFSINGSSAGIGINATNLLNISIQNCFVENFSNNILVQGTNSSILNNNTARNSTLQSINVVSAKNVLVANTTGESNGNTGLNLNEVSNVTITNVTGESRINPGIQFTSSDNSTVLNSRGLSVSGQGIRLAGTDNVIMLNVTGVSNSSAGIDINSGSSNNLVANSTASCTTGRGVALVGSAVNNMIINTTVDCGTIGVLITVTSTDNNLINTTIAANGTWLINDGGSTGNTFNSTVFRSFNGSIHILSNFTLPASTNVSVSRLNVSANRAFLNSGSLSFLNQTAIIALNGVTSGDPTPTFDFEDDGTFTPCLSTANPFCTELIFIGGVFVFNTSHFTTFSSTEGSINVSLTKTDSPDPVNASSFLNYTITINVTSDSPANVTLTDTYPNQTIFISAQPTPITGTNNTFVLGNLTNGTVVRVNITVLVLNLSNGTVINNTANISFQNATGATIRLNVTENTTVLNVTAAAAVVPNIAQVILNSTLPESNHTLENLTFFVINSTGPNSNPVQNISDWRRWNGTEFESIALLNFPFETNVTSTASGAVRNYVSRRANATLGDGVASQAPVSVLGQVGRAYSFDNIDDVIRQTSRVPYGFNESDEITAMAWVNLASLVDFDFWLTMQNELGGFPYRFGSTSAGNPRWNMAGASDQEFSGFAFNTSVWYHVAFVGRFNGTSIYTFLYINGTRVHTADSAQTIFPGANSSLIGTGESVGTHPFNGFIDEVQVFRRALSDEQIRHVFEEGLQARRPNTLVHNETHAREIWQVAVTPNNHSTDGVTVLSNNLTVLSDPPGNVQVVLNTTNPATNDTDQNLTAFITNATDPANNTVHNITDWRVNGTSIAIMNFPFDIDETSLARLAVRNYGTSARNATLGDGSLVFAPKPVLGKVGFGYLFDGGNDGIREVSGVPYGFNETNETTVMAWINLVSSSGFDFWLTMQNELGGFPYRFGSTSAGNPRWNMAGGGDQEFSGFAFNTSVWYHVAFVGRFNGSTIYTFLYINGTRMHTENSGQTAFAGANSSLIGTGENFGTHTFNGIVDEVQVFRRALSDEQIRRIFEEGNAGRHLTTIVSNETGAGENWSVCVTPNDIDQDGNTTCSNNVTIFAAQNVTGITSCPVTINTSTTLTQNLTSNDTCITIGADNVSLDCDGFSILYNANGTDSEYGILAVARSNITIRDCVIRDINDTGSAGIGINITDTNRSAILNTTIFTNGTTSGHGIAYNRVNVSVIANNTLLPNGTSQHIGIFVQNSDRVDMRDNTVSLLSGSTHEGINSIASVNITIAFNRVANSQGLYGVRLSSNAQSKVLFNNITLSGGGASKIGVQVGGGQFNNVTSNNISVSGAGSPLTGIEIVSGTTQNIVDANTVFVNSTAGPIYGLRVRFASSNENNLTGNTVRVEAPASEAYGIAVEDTSINNKFNRTDITVVSASGYGILIANSNHTLFDTTLLSPSGWLNVSAGILSNFTNTTFLQPNGSIRIAQLVQANGPLDATKAKLNISFNRAFLNSTNLTFFNQTGIITLNNITFIDPKPQFDFEDDGTFADCASTADPFCTEISYSGGVFVFNTSHFTTFQSTENATAITSCPVTINVSTTLTQNLTSNDTCITIGGDNVSLDCDGFSILYNANGTDNEFGIVAAGRNNLTIIDCVIRDINSTGAFGMAINLSGVNSSLIRNNTIFTNGTNDSYGIALELGSNNNRVISNNITTNGSLGINRGISLNMSTGNNVSSNTIATGGTSSNHGINVYTSANNNSISTNTITVRGSANGNYGIYLHEAASGNDLVANTISVRGGTTDNNGIQISTNSNNNSARLNNITTNGSTGNIGIHLVDRVSENNVSANNISTGGTGNNYGIQVTTAVNNRFDGNQVATIGNESYGIRIFTSNASQFTNTILSDTSEWVLSNANTFNNLTNTSFVQPNGSIRFAGVFDVNGSQNVTRAKLNVTFNRAFLNSSNLSFLNTTGIITLNGLTAGNPEPLVDFEDDGTFSACTSTADPFCTEISYSGGVFVYNTSHFTTFSSQETPTNITACPVTLNQSTTLTQNLQGSGTCVTIGNNSVTLNCNNFSILYDSAGIGGDGIVIASRTNVIIENCTIRDINASGAAGIGINVTGSTVRLRNNNILTNGSRDNHGITLFTSTTTSLIANNTISTKGTLSNNTGILVSFSTLLNITDNTVFTNGTFNNFGIRTDDFSENNRITNNSVFTDGNASFNIGIYIDLSDNTRVERNRITTNGTFSNYGVLLNDFTDYATVANNTVNSGGNNSGNIGVFIAFVSGSNNVSDNIIRTNGTFSNYGVVVQEFAAFNRIENNSISTGGSGTANYGIFLVNLSTNTTINRNAIRTSGSDSGEGILIRHFSHENNVTNNTILTNSLGGFNIGIHLESLADRNVITGNIIITNGTSSSNGINLLNETDDNRIENNSITTDGSSSFNWGIWLNFSTAVINRNFIRANGRSDGDASSVNGITLQSSTVGSTVENNTIIVLTNGSNNFGIDDAVFEANLTNNVISVTGSRESHGIRKIFSERSIARNNTITVSGADSDALQVTDANTNSFINNTVVSHTRYAAHVTRSLRNTFSQSLLPAAVGSLYVNESNGSIAWYPSVNITSATNLSQVINVSFNHIRLNSTDANGGQLNHSAELEFRALTFLEPQPIRDIEDDGTFLLCAPPTCREKNYTNGIYTYNVTAFTTYAAGETGGSLIALDKSDSPDPVNASATLTYTINVTSLGNATAFNVTLNDTYPAQVIFQSSQPTAVSGTNNTFILGNLTNGTSILVNITVLVLNVSNGTVINNTANVTFQNATGALFSAAENESTVVENITVSAPAPAPAAGGGGGGGWTTPTPPSVFPEQEQPLTGGCFESWACEGWSQCENGRQVRECIDLGRCNTTRFLPLTERACVEPVQESPAAGTEFPDLQPPELELAPPVLPEGLPWKWIITILIILLCIAVLTATFRAGYQPGIERQRMPPVQETRLPPASQRVPKASKAFYAKLDKLDRELDDVEHGRLPKMPQPKPAPAQKKPKIAKEKPIRSAPEPRQFTPPPVRTESNASPQVQGLLKRLFRVREREAAIENEDARLRVLEDNRRRQETQSEEERAARQLERQKEREIAKEVALQQKLARNLERERLRDEKRRVQEGAKRVRDERAQALRLQRQEREQLIEERKRLRIEEARARKERLQQQKTAAKLPEPPTPILPKAPPAPKPALPTPLPAPKPASARPAKPKIGKEAEGFYQGLKKYDDDLDRLEAELQKKLKKR